MEKINVVGYLATVTLLLYSSTIKNWGVGAAKYETSSNGSEECGYVQVRPGAHMFWLLYKSPYRVLNSQKPWPTILWLQGGPGASGVAIGSFQEIGPQNVYMKPRNSTWLKKADLLFV
ncbi:unnamed protein product, partial [Cuscuta europaea]